MKYEIRAGGDKSRESSPSRGTWIEIARTHHPPPGGKVVPHTGALELNEVILNHRGAEAESSPSRGTWIEIKLFFQNIPCDIVVPLTGDVD